MTFPTTKVKTLLLENVIHSINLLLKEVPKVEPSLIEVIGNHTKKHSTFMMKIAEVALKPLPWFYEDNYNILSPQSSFFGFYAFRNVLRGILLGSNYFKSGNILFNRWLYSPSISMYYTSLFHFLHSFLALEGRIVIEPVMGPIEVQVKEDSSTINHKLLSKHPDVIIAILTTINTWIFEKRNRSHKKRWQELNIIFNEHNYEIPHYFVKLFNYLNSYGPYDNIKNSDINNFLKEISEIRHKALYECFGFDDFAYDAAINKELEAGVGLGVKTKQFKLFASEFFKDILSKSIELIQKVKINAKIKMSLGISINTPPLELCDLQDFEDDEIYKMLYFLMDWLFSDI
jgi:hypothetical protein